MTAHGAPAEGPSGQRPANDEGPTSVSGRIAPEAIELPRGGLLGAGRRAAGVFLAGTRHFAPVIARRITFREGRSGHAARRMFESLGATYIKFGQFVAAAPGIVGDEIAAEFRTCLDTGPAVPFAKVRATVESELGRPMEDVFEQFEEASAAAASIAVVHRAKLRDGAPVAVKVLRPGIERLVATDLAMMERAARFAARQGMEQGYNMVSLVVGLRAQIAEELNLRNEARTMEVFRALFERFELRQLVIPRVHDGLTGRRVLTMEWLDGASIDDLAHAEALGVDLAPLVRELLRAWVMTGLQVGAFHADIHAGNLLLLRDGRLAMIDWGIVARMDGEAHRMFRALCEASLGHERAWDEIADVMLRLNGPGLRTLGLTDAEIRRLVRAMFEPVLTRPLSEVSMADLMMTGDDLMEKATGERPPKRSLIERWRLMRLGGRAYREAAESGALEHPTMRMGFLSIKQLVYLERYARMYIPEESLLGDGEFVRRALEGAMEPSPD